MHRSNIRTLIRSIIEDTLTEMTATGDAAGYETPYAFSRKSLTPELSKRNRKIPNGKKGGYKIKPQGDPKGPSSNMIRSEGTVVGAQHVPESVWETDMFYVAMNKKGDTKFFDKTSEGKKKAESFSKSSTRHDPMMENNE